MRHAWQQVVAVDELDEQVGLLPPGLVDSVSVLVSPVFFPGEIQFRRQDPVVDISQLDVYVGRTVSPEYVIPPRDDCAKPVNSVRTGFNCGEIPEVLVQIGRADLPMIVQRVIASGPGVIVVALAVRLPDFHQCRMDRVPAKV